jgi:phosphatidylserine decarboxylase
MSEPEAIIEKLRDTVEKEKGLADLVERSLVKAREWAEAELDPNLFSALEWPTDIGEYEDYLKRFIRPHESNAEAWKQQGKSQELSDRMSHFYFLVDQKVDDEAPQDSDVFREWMTEFARQWGSFLDSPESFSPEVAVVHRQRAGVPRPGITGRRPAELAQRLVDGKPVHRARINGGLRPIAEPASNLVITSPADCSY